MFNFLLNFLKMKSKAIKIKYLESMYDRMSCIFLRAFCARRPLILIVELTKSMLDGGITYE
jgi:hypothetical protein